MNKKTVFKAFGMLMTGVLFFALYSAARTSFCTRGK